MRSCVVPRAIPGSVRTARDGEVPAPIARLLRAARAALAGGALLLAACSGGNDTATSATPPPVVTPPAELTVQRGGLVACYVSQHPAADFPAVKGYRLAALSPLPDGVTSSVKGVRFAGSGAARVIEAQVCFQAGQAAAPGRHEAHLELRLYNADAERLSFNDRLQPVRTLPVTQVIQVQ